MHYLVAYLRDLGSNYSWQLGGGRGVRHLHVHAGRGLGATDLIGCRAAVNAGVARRNACQCQLDGTIVIQSHHNATTWAQAYSVPVPVAETIITTAQWCRKRNGDVAILLLAY